MFRQGAAVKPDHDRREVEICGLGSGDKRPQVRRPVYDIGIGEKEVVRVEGCCRLQQ